MASFPCTFQANFETADLNEFDSATGTQVELRSYRELARNVHGRCRIEAQQYTSAPMVR